MAVIGLLHTSEVHRSVFEELAAELDPAGRVVTLVDETLLERARQGSLTDPLLVDAVRSRLAELADDGAGPIVCTCSTIGGVAETVGAELAADVVRVDRAMAERAVAIGGTVVVLAALESTVAPTRDLIESVARSRGARITVEPNIVPDAWQRFDDGDIAGYHALVADAIGRVGDEAHVVVLAQASMAPVTGIVEVEVPVFSSPRLAMNAVLGLP